MTLATINAARRSQPFQPFSIHTAAGESYVIAHPENIATHEHASVVLMLYGEGNVAMVDLASVTEVAAPPRPLKVLPNDN